MEKILEKISFSNLMRYGYSGFLLYGILLYFSPNDIIDKIGKSSDAILIILIFFIGACVYIIYRHIIGEILLYPISHLLHRILSWVFKISKGPIEILGAMGVPILQRRAAYNLIRRDYLENKQGEKLNVIHSEAHLLYLTSVLFFCTWIIIKKNSPNEYGDEKLFLSISSIFILLAAFYCDILQHQIEGRKLFKKSNDEKIKTFLIENGFLAKKTEV